MQKVVLLALALLFTIVVPFTALSNDMTSLSCPVTVLNSSQESTVVSFSTEPDNSASVVKLEQVVEDNQTFDHYTIEGEGFTYEYGKPQLPCISRFVIVPPDRGLELVVDAGQLRRIQAENKPLICTAEDLANTVSVNAATKQEVYPASIAEMTEPFIMRGVRMVRIDTYPVQYDPIENVYLCHDNITTEIRYTNDSPINPVEQPIRRNRSPEFMKFLRSFAINSDVVGRDDPEDYVPEYVGHYLVVTHENCLEYAYDFIEWRRKSGWKVDILSLSSGDAGNPGRVRGYIRERYDAYVEAGIAPFDMIMLIGDHGDYYGLSPAANWILQTDAGRSIWPNNCAHNDYYYTELEGNDHYADVGIARWIAGSEATLNLFSERTLSYEVTPDMEETDWFTRGFVYDQKWGGNYHISLATNVRWGVEVLKSLGFDDVTSQENNGQWEYSGEQVGPKIRDAFNDRTNVMIGRAENYFWRNDINGMNATGVYPIDLDIAGHHEWTCWNMMRMPVNGGGVRGPVAASTGWGGQATLPYSIIWLEVVNGFLQQDMTFGWAHIKGVLSPETYIPGQEGSYWEYCRTDVVFYGDPGIQYWRGVPKEVELEYKSTIAPTDKMVSVYVLDADEESDLEGAQVTIYVPGDMPAADSDDYADYGEMFMMTKKTDTQGMAVFVIPEDIEFEEGAMYLTVTGRNILPNLNEIEITQPEAGVELSGWLIDQQAGNDDDNINPGEVFFLDLTAQNLSEDVEIEDVTAVITSLSPYLEVANENSIDFGTIEGGEEVDGQDGVSFTVAFNCPDGSSRPSTKPSLKVSFLDDDNNKIGETAIQFDPVAPDFVVRRIVDGNIIADSLDYVNPVIENIGRMAAPQVTATMVSLGMGVSVVDNEASYPALEPNESAQLNGNGFRVAGNRLVVPGSAYDVVLALETEDGFIDSAYFRLQVMEARENAPQGPDRYGYICFDDTDTDWDIAPEYEWIEISIEEREREFDGDELDLNTNAEIGETIVIDLPFETQFYGRIYDQLTVATNGFISMGDQECVTNYQNWPMDRAIGGGVGMMAPFWDDLRFGDGGGVYTYYDDQESQFIIEWYKMRHRTGGNSDLTFQVIIYDRDIWITETGDQNILFQYKTIANAQGRAGWANASPYASVGISSPEGTTGINYTFNNTYPVTSAELEARRALLFATSPRYRAGALFGRVTNARDNSPIEQAVVSTLHGFTALTDADGNWRINDALADIEFSITCIKPGFNDSTEYNLMVEEDGELEINFSLLHPEFTPSTLGLSKFLDPELTSILPFSIENTGNGPLDWTLARRLPGNADVDPWEFRMSYAVADSVADARVEGVIFANNCFYISGSNILDGVDTTNMIYVLDRDGHEISRFPQPGDTRYGMKDLAWDDSLIWGCADNVVIGFTTEGDSITSFVGPDGALNAITWDPDREVLWVARKTGRAIYAVTREGEEVTSIPRYGFRLYGLAYWQDSEDDAKLYIYHSPDNSMDLVHKVNPETQDTTFVRNLDHVVGDSPRGAFCTNQYDVYSWVFMCISDNDAADLINIWQLDARRDWFRVFTDIDGQRTEVDDGRIDATIEQDFELQLSSVDLPDTTFIGMLTFSHNAEDAETVIDVMLDVIGPMPPTAFNLLKPANSDTVDANPSYDTTSVVFGWQPSIEYNYDDTLTYVIWLRSGADTVSIDCADDTLMVEMNYLINELGLPIETEFQLEWWVEAYSGEDIVPSDEHFTLRFSPHGVNWDDMLPIEFGLHSIYPSPFNSMTTIKYGIEVPERIRIRIFDLQGRTVATLVDGVIKRGNHNLVWDASKLSSGLYIVRLEAPGRSQIMKAALVR